MSLAQSHPLERLLRVGLDSPFVQNALDKLVQDQIAHETAELKRLHPRLSKYEIRYNMPSETFFTRYQNGDLSDDMDFFEWNVLYKMFVDSQHRLRVLQGEEE
jgi:hypothetical protein